MLNEIRGDKTHQRMCVAIANARARSATVAVNRQMAIHIFSTQICFHLHSFILITRSACHAFHDFRNARFGARAFANRFVWSMNFRSKQAQSKAFFCQHSLVIMTARFKSPLFHEYKRQIFLIIPQSCSVFCFNDRKFVLPQPNGAGSGNNPYHAKQKVKFVGREGKGLEPAEIYWKPTWTTYKVQINLMRYWICHAIVWPLLNQVACDLLCPFWKWR